MENKLFRWHLVGPLHGSNLLLKGELSRFRLAKVSLLVRHGKFLT
ncbi:hypothetical protein PEB0150_021830 [Bartonella apis]|nr:hypothetical protein PEB0150_021830 [Bartonella apis]